MIALLLLIFLLMLAAPVSAATVSSTTRQTCASPANCWPAQRIEFYAAPGETNDVTITREGGDYRFSDAGAPLQASGECRSLDERTALCPAPHAFEALVVRLGDGADRSDVPANATVEGGDGDDALVGGHASGGPGNDVLTGPGLMEGGDGDDRITGGQVSGGPGDDTIEIVGPGGSDPGPGSDVLLGSSGDDHISDSDADRDRIDGRGGRDVLSYENRPSMVVVALSPAARVPGSDDLSGIEHVAGSAHPDVLEGGDGPDSFDGGPGDDLIHGHGGADVLLGDGGTDTLVAGAGDDTVAGGADRDVVDLGDGDDRASTHDDFFADQLDCGPGDDGGDADRGDRRAGCEGLRLHRPAGLRVWAQPLRDGRFRLRYACGFDWPACSGMSEIRARGRRIAIVRFGPVGNPVSSLRSGRFRARGSVLVRTFLDLGPAAGVLPFERRLRLVGRPRRAAQDR